MDAVIPKFLNETNHLLVELNERIYNGHYFGTSKDSPKNTEKESFPSVKVWVFGSRAVKEKKNSDLDLAVESKRILPISIISSLEHDFSESDLPYKVDIVDLNNISESFRKKFKLK